MQLGIISELSILTISQIETLERCYLLERLNTNQHVKFFIPQNRNQGGTVPLDLSHITTKLTFEMTLK
jgi:hypothetical protein